VATILVIFIKNQLTKFCAVGKKINCIWQKVGGGSKARRALDF